MRNDDNTERPICGNCVLCICTNQGCECQLTDNEVDYNQEACVDYIDGDEGCAI